MLKQKYPDVCPSCEAKMINDAWELINFLPNGDIQLDTIYPAWVCSNWCGFYVKIKDDFNDHY